MPMLSMLSTLMFSGLVVLLTVVGFVEQARRVRRRRSAPTTAEAKRTAAGVGIDTMSAVFTPAYRHKIEYDDSREVRRDQAGEDAPPFSRVDLQRGVARLVIRGRERT